MIIKLFKKKLKAIRKWIFLGMVIAIILLIGIIVIMAKQQKAQEKQPTIITSTSLEKIVDINELYTYLAHYNGIAKVANEEKPEKIDFYVKYESQIKAGINVKEIDISVNEETKTITVSIPDAQMEKPIVDEATLDYIFNNNKSDDIGITGRAISAVENDIAQEFDSETLLKLANENARVIVQGLIEPFVKQFDVDYTLVFK